MAKTLTLCDEYGIIYEAMQILPNNDLKIGFLEALAELEDNECHRTRKFPKTRLHKLIASDKLLERCPDAQTWFIRIGHRGVHHFGWRNPTNSIAL